MGDNILQVKKEMISVINSKGMTRREKYSLLREKRKMLSKKERKILLKECRRDYESWNRFQDIKELITVFLTGLGLFLTAMNIFFKDSINIYTKFQSILAILCIYVCMSVLILSIVQSWRGKNLNISKYMIDILEEK